MPWTIIWRLPDGSYLVENRTGPKGSRKAVEFFAKEENLLVAVIAGTHEVHVEHATDN